MADKPPYTKEVAKRAEPLQLEVKQIARTDSVFNTNQIQKIFNTTPKRFQYNRPGKGGGSWNYVRASYVRRVLDGLFGFNWDFEIETTLAEAFEVAKLTKTCVVKGILTGRTKSDGEWHTIKKTQFGRAEVKFKSGTTEPLDFGNDMKAATSDALKKCATMLGIAADVYDPDEFQEIEILGSDEASDRQKRLKTDIATAKKVIKAQATEVGKENE